MKILILGGAGMLGHKLWQVLAEQFDTYITLRTNFDAYARFKIFERTRTLDCVDAQDFDTVVRAVAAVRPEVIVNCIGIVKQHPATRDSITSISVNSLFPHRLAHLCRAAGIRLIHMSTDCVFSGRKGKYVESDVGDAEDLYGMTKLLGEPVYDGCVTLRTSMIGRELMTSHGLLEWFLQRAGESVPGYRRAIFSGFTTEALSRLIGQIIRQEPNLNGVWHIACEPVSKFELLSLVKDVYGLNVEIEADETVVYDRSLDASRFAQRTRFVPQPWRDMVEQMFKDPTPYAEFRRVSC